MADSKAKTSTDDDKAAEAAAPETETMKQDPAAEPKAEVYVPEDGPSVEDPAVIPVQALASAGSTADVPSPGPDVVIVRDGSTREEALAERDALPEGGAVDAEGSHAGRVLTGEYDPKNATS